MAGADGDAVESSDAPTAVQRPVTDVAALPARSGPWGERYTLVRKLGEGGMGEVYVAYDEQLDRRVAMKLLRRAAASAAEEQRILREAQALARLSHPNVVQVHDVGRLGDQIFVAMELVVGANLRQWCRAAPRGWREVLDKVSQAGEGLVAAHAAGLIHRDIKPDNLLVGDDGRVRVADFGLARTESAAEPPAEGPPPQGSLLATPLTQAGEVVGTPAYMAPEQFLLAPPDVRCDVYALCVVLYEALYGERPFRGKDWRELAAAVLAGRFTPPPREPPVPGWLVRVITRGLARDPKERYPTVAALLADLRRPLLAARRRWLAAGGVAALAAGVALGQGVLSRGSPCEGAADAAAAVWTPERADPLRAALEAWGEVGAETWQRTEARVARYVDDLKSMSSERCESYHRGELSDRLYDLGRACVERRRGELEALLGVLASGDREVLARAVQALAGLREVASCGDGEALLARVAPPAPGDEEAARALVRRVDGARAQRLAGRYQEADAAAAPLVDEARALGYGPATAEALTERALVAMERARWKEAAEVDLPEALSLAEAAGADDLRLAALIAWVRALGRVEGKGAALVEVAERSALALVERLGAAGRRIHGQALLAAGEAYLERGDQARADDRLSQAQRILEVFGDEAAAELGEVLNDLAIVRLKQRRYAEAHAAYDRARELLARAQGPHHPNLGFLANNEGRAFDKEGDPRTARERFAQALALWEPFYGPDHPNTLIAVTHLARISLALDDLAAARAYAERSVESRGRAEGAEHASLVHPLLLLARVGLRDGRPAAAAAAAARALAIQERTYGADSPKLREALVVAAEAALADARAADALALAERAHGLAEGPGPKAKARLLAARARWALGERAAARRDAEEAAEEAEARGEAQAWLAEHPLADTPARPRR